MKILEIKNLTKKYDKFTLDNVSFDIEEGSICGFIGRNGAGKTTTLKSIVGLIHPTSGEISVFGKEFFKNELEIKQMISFSLSEINFYPDRKIGYLTNVTKRFYPNWNDETYKKLCEKFGLDQSKRVRELSSGMKVKYNLAIALSHNAKFLIFDEPTSGLDPVSRDEVLDIFKSLVKDRKRSILFSTHITSDLDKCADHIVYIKKGQIIAKDKKNEFINSYKHIVGSVKDLENNKNVLISFKKDEEKYEGLVKTNDIKLLKGKFKSSTPDLETAMIYLEKQGEQDEEFIF